MQKSLVGAPVVQKPWSVHLKIINSIKREKIENNNAGFMARGPTYWFKVHERPYFLVGAPQNQKYGQHRFHGVTVLL